MSRTAPFPIALAGFTAFLDLYATQPLLPLLSRVFDASQVAVSLTVTASTVAVAIGAPLIGRFADFVGRKRVIVASAAALTIATVLAATSRTLAQLVFWRFVQGLCTPGVFATTIAYIHEEWPAAQVGRGMAAYVSGTVVGGFCGRAVAGLVGASYGWQAPFVVLAAMNLAAAMAVAVYLPRERVSIGPRAGVRRGGPLVALLANQRLMATNAVGFCLLFTQVAMFTYVTFHLEAPPFALGTAALGSLFAVYLIGAALTSVAGRWIDDYGHRASLAAGMTIGAAGALLTLVASLPAVVAGLALVSTAVFVSQATASGYIGLVTERDRGLAVGLYSLCYYVGGSLGAIVPGVSWRLGGWTACVVLVAAVQVATVALALTFWTGKAKALPYDATAGI
jgi:predicted MFS family arabinose efflux permease